MDGTLTESRSQIDDNMSYALEDILAQGGDVVVITGADQKRIDKQMKGAPKDILYMSQCGNSCDYWENVLTDEQKEVIYMHIELLQREFPIHVIDEKDLIQDRGCQITYSLIGHHAPSDIKKAFDPEGKGRANMLHACPFDCDDLCARVGGTTSIDYTQKNGTKGKNIERLLTLKHWNKDECVYIGDALHENGNDETVIGVIPNLIKVKNHNETLEIIKELTK